MLEYPKRILVYATDQFNPNNLTIINDINNVPLLILRNPQVAIYEFKDIKTLGTNFNLKE
jgi:hypothetical protein